VHAAPADGGVGELGLTVEQEGALGDYAVALDCARENLDVAVPHAPEADAAGGIALPL
jgi:hypothetical protein